MGDRCRLVRAQLEDLELHAAELAGTRALLCLILSRLNRREPIDVATFCSLIRKGNIMTIEQKQWDQVSDRYFTPGERTEFAAAMASVPSEFLSGRSWLFYQSVPAHSGSCAASPPGRLIGNKQRRTSVRHCLLLNPPARHPSIANRARSRASTPAERPCRVLAIASWLGGSAGPAAAFWPVRGCGRLS